MKIRFHPVRSEDIRETRLVTEVDFHADREEKSTPDRSSESNGIGRCFEQAEIAQGLSITSETLAMSLDSLVVFVKIEFVSDFLLIHCI